MTRFAIDLITARRILDDPRPIGAGHSLVGPALLRSHLLSSLYTSVQRGELTESRGRDLLERVAELKIRLLGDRVSRATAWKLAAQHNWKDTTEAEYLAVASLQADALVAEDRRLLDAAEGVIRLAGFEDLFTS